MAERRMIAKTIIDSDAFLDMSTSARLLYYDLNMRAKDKGILNNPKSICKSTGCALEDLSILVRCGYIKQIDETNIVITHWDINNGIAETAKKRLSYRYRQWRRRVLEKQNYTCQNCGSKEKVMHVHHIKPFSIYKELRYEVNNGMVLCPKCHKDLHRELRKVGRR